MCYEWEFWLCRQSAYFSTKSTSKPKNTGKKNNNPLLNVQLLSVYECVGLCVCLCKCIHISKVYKRLMKFLSQVTTCFVCIDVIKYGIAEGEASCTKTAIAYEMNTIRFRFHFILSTYALFHRPQNYPQSFIPCILSIAPPTHRFAII